MAFRGDLLATMEATYADGKAAGPPDWTTFKEYNRSFVPDYTGNTVALRPAFFEEVRDGEPVTLTFHFRTGTKVTYRITTNGTAVTGKAV
ncbi:hypothetical protein [Streptomyces sp. NBC_00078]|uniref:hypothetical protein n=1 Tax=unclassified Streptomyces TaxID=2593676 RepID=UPI00225964D0|nr:hypothetical protein [Streptomyces sp. NBC_00078]MCX5425908.1 hypothetical protein [Streptomyces sp. NBC_00078]